MRFGLSPVQSQSRFDAMRAQASLAEALGFHALWMHEHHSGGSMYPSPLMALAALSGVTSRIALGTNMLLLPLHHPLRVAEDAAMVDVMSGGRLRLGLSAGYSPADLQAFGVPPETRARRMREGIALIRAVWSGKPISLEQELCRLSDFVLHPRPVRQPSPPIYMGGTVDAAIRRAASLGDELVISTTQRISDIPRVLSVYTEALRAAGKDPRAKTPVVNRIVHVVPDGAGSQDALRFFADALLVSYQAWGHQSITGMDAQARAEVVSEQLIVGEASYCAETIDRYRAIGIGEIACLMNFGGPALDAVERSMRLFGEKVMPRVGG